MTYARPTEPAHVVDVLVEGFRLFGAGIRSLYVPAFLLALIVGVIDPIEISSEDAVQGLDFGKGDWLRFGASAIAGFYMYAAITAIVHYIASGAPEGVRSPFFIATRRFPVILAVNLLFVFAVMFGTVLLIVPGIFLLVALYFSPMLPIIEGKGPIDSIRGSFSLIRGHWWRTFAVVAITVAFAYMTGVANEKIALFLADPFDSELVANTISRLTYAAIAAIAYSLGVCVTYCLYQDLRLRQTGPRDLQTTD